MRTRGANTPAHRSIVLTLIIVAQAIIMAVDPIRIRATTRAGRIPLGVTEPPGGIIHTRTGAVLRTVVTTITTRTTRQLTATTDHWLQPCSGALANSVITTA